MKAATREQLAEEIDAVLAKYDMRILWTKGDTGEFEQPMLLDPDHDAYRIMIAPGRLNLTRHDV